MYSENNSPFGKRGAERSEAGYFQENTPSGCRLPPLSMKGELEGKEAMYPEDNSPFGKRGAERKRGGVFRKTIPLL
ncbi:MAG: hypothetical protein ACP5QS_08330, partial [bacterium]